MTERGPSPEGAPACPFVAFEDDRDARSTAPDHRHRCFAEARPAPRAVAHQEAYCLSSAFAVCPTFQDWARREAAAARPAPPADAPHHEAPAGYPSPTPDRDARRTPSTDPPSPVPPRRSQQRDWAAPPPWMGDPAGAGMAAGAAAAGAPGAMWDPEPDSPEPAPRPPQDAGRATRRGEPAPEDWGGDSRGLAGSAAHRLAGPDPDEPVPAAPDRDDAWAAGAGAYVAGTATARTGALPDDDEFASPPRRSPDARGRTGRGAPDRSGRDAQRSRDDDQRPPGPEAQELFGPAWEHPRRYEAYPTLRTRMGLPGLGGVPRVAIWGLLLLLVALLVFLFGPNLLGFGGAGDATPTPVASVEPTPTPVPTPTPEPTPQVYVVAKGDTMSKIAKKYGVTIDEILAVNPQIKNPNKIQIGDEIVIPTPVEDGNGFVDDGTVAGESATP